METNMQNCASCGSAMGTGAVFCPVCGAQTKIKGKREKKYLPRFKPLQKVGLIIDLIFVFFIDMYCFAGWAVNNNVIALVVACVLLAVIFLGIISLKKRW